MPIKLQCNCGKTLTVPDDAAGRRARCPACNAVVNVPGTPPAPPARPEEERGASATRVDQVVDVLASDIAKSRERAPQLTEIAVALAVWSGVSFVLTFFASLGFGDESGKVAYWFLVYVPMCVTGALLALAMIKAWPHTPDVLLVAAPVIIGANYALFWWNAEEVTGWRHLFHLLVNIVNLGGFAFLYWYFRWHGIAAIFEPEEADEPTTAQRQSRPAEGTETK